MTSIPNSLIFFTLQMFQTNGGVVDSKTAYMLLCCGDVIVLKLSSNAVDRLVDAQHADVSLSFRSPMQTSLCRYVMSSLSKTFSSIEKQQTPFFTFSIHPSSEPSIALS
jgi:hypothetical protein